jgi:hypothetical protein
MIDHVKDLNHSYLYNLDESEGLPDFVKQAGLLQEEQAKLMGSNLFADAKNRLFPTHSKADTWLSAAFYEKYAKQDYDKEAGAKIESRLRDMCAFWGVEYTEPKVEKVASTQVAIEYRYDGIPQKTVVVESGDQLEKLASFVTNSAKEMPWEMRREAARQILDGQSSFATIMNQNLLTDLHKTAGYGVGDVNDVVHEIHKRKIYLDRHKGTEGGSQLDPLIDMVKESSQNGVVDPDTLDKVAMSLDAVDKVLGLTPKYGQDINPPEKTLFSFSTFDEDLLSKEAVQLPSGQTVANTFLEDYSVRSFMGEFLGSTPESGQAKEAAAKLTARQSAKVYNFMQKHQVA